MQGISLSLRISHFANDRSWRIPSEHGPTANACLGPIPAVGGAIAVLLPSSPSQ